MASKNIFIAFTGPKIEQAEPIHQIAPGYECWDLTKFSLAEFVSRIKGRIPPINENVLNNYERKPGEPDDSFGIYDENYKICSWGLLLPDLVPDAIGGGYAEILFLLDLYSPHFLYPVFYVTDFGVSRPNHRKSHLLYCHDQNQVDRFRRKAFVKYYEALISESVYGSWQADRMAHWDKEDWRLFVACLLFTELKAYENSKEVFTWRRESANLVTILESLLTAKGSYVPKVGPKVKKRITTLMGFRFPNIERDIDELYDQRHDFVHGSFFLRVKKDVEIRDGLAILPSPPFLFLYRQKEYIRHFLAAYLYLNNILKSGPTEFKGLRDVLEILEKSIIDADLRAKVRQYAEAILGLM